MPSCSRAAVSGLRERRRGVARAPPDLEGVRAARFVGACRERVKVAAAQQALALLVALPRVEDLVDGGARREGLANVEAVRAEHHVRFHGELVGAGLPAILLQLGVELLAVGLVVGQHREAHEQGRSPGGAWSCAPSRRRSPLSPRTERAPAPRPSSCTCRCSGRAGRHARPPPRPRPSTHPSLLRRRRPRPPLLRRRLSQSLSHRHRYHHHHPDLCRAAPRRSSEDRRLPRGGGRRASAVREAPQRSPPPKRPPPVGRHRRRRRRAPPPPPPLWSAPPCPSAATFLRIFTSTSTS